MLNGGWLIAHDRPPLTSIEPHPLSSPSISPVTILGANGGFGQLFASALRGEGIEVRGVDLQPDPVGNVVGYAQGDALDLRGTARELVATARCVILILPEVVTLESVVGVAEAMPKESLLLDVLSVKLPICRRLGALSSPAERISIHPMFRSSLGFEGRNVAVIDIAPGPLAASFLSLLVKWGATVTHLDAEQHDQNTAAMQVATHAALLAFGNTLTSLGYDVTAAWPVMTPLHHALLALLSRVVTSDPNIYWDIQRNHPLASKTREEVGAGLRQLEEMMVRGDNAAFAALFAAIRDELGPHLDQLRAEGESIFRTQTAD